MNRLRSGAEHRPARSPGTRAHLRWVAAALVLMTLVTSCGVPDDSQPQALPPEVTDLLVPSTTQAPTTPLSDDTAPLYFLSDQRLVRVDRKVITPRDPQAVFQLLIAGPTEDEQRARGLTSAIPADVGAVRATVDADGVLVLELGSALGNISGSAAKASYAQMVFTAQAIGFDRVRFVVGGKAVDAPTDDGNRRVVRADNYGPPLSPR